MSDFLTFLKTNVRWLSAGALLAFMSSFGQTFFISIFSDHIRTEFDLSHAAWGGIYSLGTTASAVVMVWAGGLADRFRTRTVGAAVFALLAAACVAMASVPNAAALPFVIFALRLFGQGMSMHLAIVAMARWFVAGRGRALSVSTLGFTIAEAFLPMIFVAAMVFVSWRGMWLVCAGLLILAIPALFTLLRQERTPQSMAEHNSTLGMGSRHWARRETLFHPLFWAILPALMGPSAFGTAFFFQQVPFSKEMGLEHLQLVALFPIYSGLSVLAMFASGFALDRFGTARLLPYALVPMAMAFVVYGSGHGQVAVAVGLIFMALSNGANATLPAAFWAEFYGTRHLGGIKAMATAVMVFGSALGPGITGLFIDLGVPLQTQYLCFAVYFLLASLILTVGIRRYRRDIMA